MLNLPKPNIRKLTAWLAVLTWLGLLFVDITRIFQSINQMEPSFASDFSYILEIIFFLLASVFFTYSISENQNKDFMDLIWRGASTGLIATLVAVGVNVFYLLLGDSRLASDPLLKNFFYHVNFALISLFLISTSLLWRHLILYQKTKRVVQQWQIFEILLLISMFFVFFNKNTLDYSFLFGMVFLGVFSISLSVNLKWIPYLTFKEKWKTILFLFIILFSTVYLFFEILAYSDSTVTFVNLTDNLFLVGLFIFIFTYSLFSFLVTLFNLPTSSVFEQKLKEAINFQKLSQSIKPGQNEDQVLDILIDSSMSASYADAGWLKIKSNDGEPIVINERFISKNTRIELEGLIQDTKPFSEFDWSRKDNEGKIFSGRIAHPLYKSGLVIPLVINKKTFGTLFLLKEVKDGFNKEMLNIISTFVGQASISVENYRLLNEAIENERYKEELQIAQRVQQSLLPQILHHNEHFEIYGFSEAADEVGGDYYETKKLNDHTFAIIIADVSGKGTSAAFNMSQMKGVFHSLVLSNPSPSEFIEKANMALGSCLERNHFITASYLILDTEKQEISYCRAGHCPTLYYSHVDQQASYHSSGGLGLGIIRSDQYKAYIHESELNYGSGDVVLLFTDGIIEAKNKNGEEFGYEGLKVALEKLANKEASEIHSGILKEIYGFVGEAGVPDDDFSFLTIKFNS